MRIKTSAAAIKFATWWNRLKVQKPKLAGLLSFLFVRRHFLVFSGVKPTNDQGYFVRIQRDRLKLSRRSGPQTDF